MEMNNPFENGAASSGKLKGDENGADDRYYTEKFKYRCPVDSSDVIHTVRFRKATCTRVDDIVEDFHCSRNSTCVRCLENYR